MILLISDSQNDDSSKKIEAWLAYYKADFATIESGIIDKYNFTIENGQNHFTITTDHNKIDLQTVRSLFFRRKAFKMLNYDYVKLLHKSKKEYTKNVLIHLINEESRCLDFLYKYLEHANKIGSFFRKEINKIEVLHEATKLQIDIPDTIVTTSKSELINFRKRHKRIITKCIYEGVHYTYRKNTYVSYTERVLDRFIDQLQDNFIPTLFQEEIAKAFELRVFYLLGKCYSMAIFSQKNKQTQIDFRHYDDQYPNRNIPFKLPKEVEKKICSLMDKMELSYGSLDFIYTPDGRFVFLEINPEGIFEMVSVPCNYNLEKIIAQQLIAFDHEKKKDKKSAILQV